MDELKISVKQNMGSLTNRTTHIQVKARELFLTTQSKQVQAQIQEIINLLEDLKEAHTQISNSLDKMEESNN